MQSSLMVRTLLSALRPPPRRTHRALLAQLTALGYQPGDPLEVRGLEVHLTPHQAWVEGPLPFTTGCAMAAHLAGAIPGDVHVFTASVLVKGDAFELVAQEGLVNRKGALSSSVVPMADELMAEDAMEMCDNKPHALCSIATEHAREAWFKATTPDTPFETARLADRIFMEPPPSTNNAKIDGLASRVRLAKAARIVEVDQRPCVRITSFPITALSMEQGKVAGDDPFESEIAGLS